eukprot:m.196901 g.196901  ORF g.196901 m.196901 type:complete len:56 (-) comp17017_c0_seq2:1749-1916(-)
MVQRHDSTPPPLPLLKYQGPFIAKHVIQALSPFVDRLLSMPRQWHTSANAESALR